MADILFKTVASDAEFKTYAEGCAASTKGTVYLNDESKCWTFTKDAAGNINAVCLWGGNIDQWVYDGTNWSVRVTPSDNAYSHNMIYRGKDLTVYSNDELHAMVADGSFRDIYPGDYFDRTMPAFNVTVKDAANADVNYTRSAGTVRFYVAHLNYMNHTGNTDFGDTNNMILLANICDGKMNNTNITTGAYWSSAMQKFLNSNGVLSAYQSTLGSSYVKTGWRDLPATAVGTFEGRTNGASSWGWQTTNFRLCNENVVYGCQPWSTGYDSGIFHTQFAIFRGNPRAISRVAWWLSSVHSATYFCSVSSNGGAVYNGASNSYAVVPICIFI